MIFIWLLTYFNFNFPLRFCVYEYGCVKIIPPESYKPPKIIDKESDRKLPIRYQTLQELSQGKPFSVNDEGVTCKELMKKDLGSSTYKELTQNK